MSTQDEAGSVVVRAENLSLELNLIGDRVAASAEGSAAVGGRLMRRGRTWSIRALDRLTFEVRRGCRVGIVGRNGAGKSSLLRILAGIYLPTEGELSIEGRISTLFANRVFNSPHVTGRESIIVSGLLLGLGYREIQELTPEIIAFSELEDYIDLPVRTYSAGMATRLGFAIATSIRPDVLLIDEVFGAGDRSFQQKARERIDSVMKEASTLFLASQSLGVIERMCDHLIWLDHGALRAFGPIGEVLPVFLDADGQQGEGSKDQAATTGTEQET